MSTLYERVKVEADDLDDKTAALERFMETGRFVSLPHRQRNLMSGQLNLMLAYSLILRERMVYLASLPIND